MKDTKLMWGKVVMIAVVVLAAGLVAAPVYAQGPGNAGPLPGINLANGPGLPLPPIPGINPNDPRMNNLIGTALGTFLGYMVQNNINNNNRDRYYHDRDPYRYRDYRYYGRPYGGYDNPYYGNRYYRYDRDDDDD